MGCSACKAMEQLSYLQKKYGISGKPTNTKTPKFSLYDGIKGGLVYLVMLLSLPLIITYILLKSLLGRNKEVPITKIFRLKPEHVRN